jgi:hypothetical protein
MIERRTAVTDATPYPKIGNERRGLPGSLYCNLDGFAAMWCRARDHKQSNKQGANYASHH